MSGRYATTPQPSRATPHATATPYHLNRHALRACEMISVSNSSIGASSEHGLGNDHDVARLHRDVLVDLASVHEIVELHMDLLGLATLGSHDVAPIPRRELREPADLDHHVEQREAVSIRHALGLRGLAEHADLVAERADELLHDYVHLRRANELGKRLLDLVRELRWCLADGDEILDQRRRNPAVGPHRDGHRQIRLSPDEHL